MEKWSYIDYNSLIESIINGGRSIQDPITIYNDSGSQSKNISFLNHIINYDNVKEDNLLEFLHILFTVLHDKIIELNKTKSVTMMIQRIMDEWYLDDDFMPENPISYQFFENNKETMDEYKKTCIYCDEIISSSKMEKEVPYESKLTGNLPIQRSAESILLIYDKNVLEINDRIKETNNLLNVCNNFKVHIFLDMALKHKQLYYLLHNSEEKLPDNIHTIYSNYIFLHTLFHKQIIQHLNKLNNILSDLENRRMIIYNLKNNIDLILSSSDKPPLEITINDDNSTLSESDDSDDSDDSDNSVLSDNDSENNHTDKYENNISSDNVSRKLLSFF